MGRKNIQQQRRRQIMNALYRCLLKKPYKDTTIKDIATEAGINHGMLHYYFKDKEEILLGFVDYILNKYKEEYLRWRDLQETEDKSPREIFEATLHYVNEKITLNRNLSKVFISFWELSLNNRKIKNRIRNVYREWIELSLEPLKGKVDEAATGKAMFSVVAYLEGMAMFSVIFNLKKDDHRDRLLAFEQKIIESLFPDQAAT